MVEEDVEPARRDVGEAQGGGAEDAHRLHPRPELECERELIRRPAVVIGQVHSQYAVGEGAVRGDADRRAVEERAGAGLCVEGLAPDGVVGDAECDAAPVGECDDRRKVGDAGGEVARSIDRVDYPDPAVAGLAVLAGLLAEHGNGWVLPRQDATDRLLCGEIYISHHIAPSLHLDSRRASEAVGEDGPGGAGSLERDVDCRAPGLGYGC